MVHPSSSNTYSPRHEQQHRRVGDATSSIVLQDGMGSSFPSYSSTPLCCHCLHKYPASPTILCVTKSAIFVKRRISSRLIHYLLKKVPDGDILHSSTCVVGLHTSLPWNHAYSPTCSSTLPTPSRNNARSTISPNCFPTARKPTSKTRLTHS